MVSDITSTETGYPDCPASPRDCCEILKKAPIGIFISTPQGRFLSVNPALARMYGYDSPDEAMGSITDLATQIYAQPEHRKQLLDLLESQGEVTGFETRHKRRDGSTFWVSVNIRILHSIQDQVVRLAGFVIDINDYRVVQDRLAQESLQRRMLVKQSRDGIVVLKSDGTVLEANKRFADMLGYTEEEIKSLHVWDWDFKRSREELLDKLNKVDSGGKSFEALYRRRDGSQLNVEISCNGIAINGNRLTFCICRDITERKKVEGALREQEALKHLLMNLATEFINAPLERIDLAINDMLKEVGKFTKVDRVYIFKHDLAGRVTSNTHEWCSRGTAPQSANLQAIPFEKLDDVLRYLQEGEPVHIPCVSRMHENHEMRSVFEQQDIQSLAVLPLVHEGLNLGFVGFDAVREPRFFTETEINILKVLAEIISNVLARQKAEQRIKKINHQLREMAMTDELTGLGNRRYFFLEGEKEIRRSKRFKTPLSLLMLDLDEFKSVNDTFGHEAGDNVLQLISGIIRTNLRQIDIFARLGGEEFGVLLPNTNALEASTLAERLCLAVSQTPFQVREQKVRITISIGLASGQDDELNLESLLNRVDAAMYQAKDLGRNRVVIATDTDLRDRKQNMEQLC